MGKKADFDKIQQLIESGDKSNINLAFVLAEAKGIHKSELIKPWLGVLRYLNKETHLKLNLRSDLDSMLCDLVATKVIEFKNCGEIPENIQKLKNIEKLSVDYDKFSVKNKIPEKLSKLEQLRELYLGSVSVPDEIYALEGLERLYLDDNQLLKIPEQLSVLKNLKSLRVEHNLIDLIPEFVFSLYNLELLSFSRNQIREIPDSINRLQQLKTLIITGNLVKDLDALLRFGSIRDLKLDSCLISELKSEIFEIPSLETLSVFQNPLIKISENNQPCNLKSFSMGSVPSRDKCEIYEFPQPLLNCRNLEKLHIQGTFIDRLPPEIGNLTNLTFLNLTFNKIKYLPESIANLKKLRSFYLAGNGIADEEKKKISALLPNTKIFFK